MNSALRGNIKMAIASVRATKWRSFLTMLGVIIGIASVVTVVSIGEGIKHQVAGQIDQLGRDLITIRPGQLADRSQAGVLRGVSLSPGSGAVGALMPQDLQDVQKTRGIGRAVPLGLVNGTVSVDSQTFSPLVLATTADLPQLLRGSLASGDFFGQDTSQQPYVAVIGSDVAESLFHQQLPLGRSFQFMGEEFVVRGVFNRFDSPPLSFATDFNNTVFIPYATSQMLTNNNTQLYEILAKPADPRSVGAVASDIARNLRAAHNDQQKFTVLQQDESLLVTNNILGLLTKLIAGIAAISLLVGGIGIMDVMLVSVAERMHEIGIRKALGATNRQILLQFLLESSVLSLSGGLVGIVLSLIIAFLLVSFTSLTPVITWNVVAIATAVSLLVGIVFGSAPAIKAARKDPIDALRNE